MAHEYEGNMVNEFDCEQDFRVPLHIHKRLLERYADLIGALEKIALGNGVYGDATGCNPQRFCDIACNVLEEYK